MKKVLMLDVNELMESAAQGAADDVFQRALEIVERHGVCYFRFTKDEGMMIIHPRFNEKINGTISDA
jgi:hypothetical protein